MIHGLLGGSPGKICPTWNPQPASRLPGVAAVGAECARASCQASSSYSRNMSYDIQCLMNGLDLRAYKAYCHSPELKTRPSPPLFALFEA